MTTQYYPGTKIPYEYPEKTASERGWGNPDSTGFSSRMRHVICRGVSLYVHWIVKPYYEGLIFSMEHIERYKMVSAGGYNNRDIRGRPGVKSNHAWGLAADFNVATNPMTEDGVTHTDMPHAHHWARIWYLFWGGDYSGDRRDPMHYECILTKRQALRYRRRARLLLKKMKKNPKAYSISRYNPQ